MRRSTIFITAICCMQVASTAHSQDFFKDLGRELTRQATQGNRGQTGRNQDTPRSRSMPSESGQKSGGGGGFGGMDGYLLPGQGNPGSFPGGGQPIQGQPYQGQPYQGQPYQGQPYQGQPYQGQPYQGQPYQGQPVITQTADIPSAPVSSSAYVVIRCPQSSTGSIRYTLMSNRGNYAFTMLPGQEQRFRASTKWAISYSDGSAQKKYRLESGKTYTLKTIEGNKWQLYSVAHPGG